MILHESDYQQAFDVYEVRKTPRSKVYSQHYQCIAYRVPASSEREACLIAEESGLPCLLVDMVAYPTGKKPKQFTL